MLVAGGLAGPREQPRPLSCGDGWCRHSSGSAGCCRGRRGRWFARCRSFPGDAGTFQPPPITKPRAVQPGSRDSPIARKPTRAHTWAAGHSRDRQPSPREATKRRNALVSHPPSGHSERSSTTGCGSAGGCSLPGLAQGQLARAGGRGVGEAQHAPQPAARDAGVR